MRGTFLNYWIYILLFFNFISLLIIIIIWQLPQKLRVGSRADCLGLNWAALAQFPNLPVPNLPHLWIGDKSKYFAELA